ncbi:MAG: hypothetical protein DRG83_15575 [Deltaproteobacteria bacterium]|nr:MAG: hypothetical protein DRG83_15575 [Deltaproteobacteria bacterium]
MKNLLKDAFAFIFYFNLFCGLAGMLVLLKVRFYILSVSTMGLVTGLCVFGFLLSFERSPEAHAEGFGI